MKYINNIILIRQGFGDDIWNIGFSGNANKEQDKAIREFMKDMMKKLEKLEKKLDTLKGK